MAVVKRTWRRRSGRRWRSPPGPRRERCSPPRWRLPRARRGGRACARARIRSSARDGERDASPLHPRARAQARNYPSVHPDFHPPAATPINTQRLRCALTCEPTGRNVLKQAGMSIYTRIIRTRRKRTYAGEDAHDEEGVQHRHEGLGQRRYDLPRRHAAATPRAATPPPAHQSRPTIRRGHAVTNCPPFSATEASGAHPVFGICRQG